MSGRSHGSVDAARDVLTTRQARKVRGVLLDLTTANAIVAVADALSSENADRLNRMELPRAAAVAWRLVR